MYLKAWTSKVKHVLTWKRARICGWCSAGVQGVRVMFGCCFECVGSVVCVCFGYVLGVLWALPKHINWETVEQITLETYSNPMVPLGLRAAGGRDDDDEVLNRHL